MCGWNIKFRKFNTKLRFESHVSIETNERSINQSIIMIMIISNQTTTTTTTLEYLWPTLSTTPTTVTTTTVKKYEYDYVSTTTSSDTINGLNDPDDDGWTILTGIFILLCVLIPMTLLTLGIILYNTQNFDKIRSKTLMFKSSDTFKTFSNLPTLSSSSVKSSKSTKDRSKKLIRYPFKHENYRKSSTSSATNSLLTPSSTLTISGTKRKSSKRSNIPLFSTALPQTTKKRRL